MDHPARTKKRDERGSILLLALIIVSVLTAAAIGASVIVMTQLRISSSTDRGIQAFYAADSGIQRGLFTVFSNRLAGSFLGNGLPCDTSNHMITCKQVMSDLPPGDENNPLVQGNGASYSLSKSSVRFGDVLTNIRHNQTYQLDLSSIDNSFATVRPLTLIIKAPNMQLKADGSEDQTPSAEIQWTYTLRSGISGINDLAPENSTVRVLSKKNVKYGVLINLFTGTPTSLDVRAPSVLPQNPSGVTDIPSGVNFDQIGGWTVRIRALNGDIPDLSAYGCANDIDCTSSSPDRFQMNAAIEIVSKGKASGASFTLKAKVPWRYPASGLFDYALFSEQTIDKPG